MNVTKEIRTLKKEVSELKATVNFLYGYVVGLKKISNKDD